MELSRGLNEPAAESVRGHNGVHAGVVGKDSGGTRASWECESESPGREMRGTGECSSSSCDGSKHYKRGRPVHDSSVEGSRVERSP